MSDFIAIAGEDSNRRPLIIAMLSSKAEEIESRNAFIKL